MKHTLLLLGILACGGSSGPTDPTVAPVEPPSVPPVQTPPDSQPTPVDSAPVPVDSVPVDSVPPVVWQVTSHTYPAGHFYVAPDPCISDGGIGMPNVMVTDLDSIGPSERHYVTEVGSEFVDNADTTSARRYDYLYRESLLSDSLTVDILITSHDSVPGTSFHQHLTNPHPYTDEEPTITKECF